MCQSLESCIFHYFISSQLLALVWDLAHVESLPTYLINQAVQSHLDILTESQAVKDSVKHTYIGKCIMDIRDGSWVVPAIRHLLNNLQALMKQPYSKSHKVRIYICNVWNIRYVCCE